MNRTFSKHATVRCQQRGISEQCVDIMGLLGYEVQQKGGSVLIRSERGRVLKSLYREIKELKKLLDSNKRYAVETDEGLVITVGHLNK